MDFIAENARNRVQFVREMGQCEQRVCPLRLQQQATSSNQVLGEIREITFVLACTCPPQLENTHKKIVQFAK